MYPVLAIICLCIFLFSLIAKRAEHSIITGPLIFLTLGIGLGPLGVNWLELEINIDHLRLLADITLALLLFSDGAIADRRSLKEHLQLPLRMLFLAIPATIALGAYVGGYIFDEFTLWQLAILATSLAATDAALAKPVINNPKVPKHLRASINMESGLNDGLCVPILLVFIALSLAQNSNNPTQFAFITTARELGVGLLVGVGISSLGFYLTQLAIKAGLINTLWRQVPAAMLALCCFTTAQALEASGYIAAFSGGICFGLLAQKHSHTLVREAEGLGEILGLSTWFIFGAAAINQVIDHFTWAILAYALLSLTVIRMIPVALSLTGSGLSWSEKLFLGWSGPRGLASMVFAIIIIHEQVPGAESIAVIIACTMILSVILHGISAAPLSQRFR